MWLIIKNLVQKGFLLDNESADQLLRETARSPEIATWAWCRSTRSAATKAARKRDGGFNFNMPQQAACASQILRIYSSENLAFTWKGNVAHLAFFSSAMRAQRGNARLLTILLDGFTGNIVRWLGETFGKMSSLHPMRGNHDSVLSPTQQCNNCLRCSTGRSLGPLAF